MGDHGVADMAAMPTKCHAALLAVFLSLIACSADREPRRVIERRTTTVSAPRGDALLRAAVLEGHDRARAALGLPPMIWSDALAQSARTYAQEMARTRRFEHAHQAYGPGFEGENLFTGSRGDYSYAEMVQLWIDERRDFVNGVTPAFSRTGRWQDTAHYARIVWRQTTHVGCALASNAKDDYLVCRYLPPGNVVGERAY